MDGWLLCRLFVLLLHRNGWLGQAKAGAAVVCVLLVGYLIFSPSDTADTPEPRVGGADFGSANYAPVACTAAVPEILN